MRLRRSACRSGRSILGLLVQYPLRANLSRNAVSNAAGPFAYPLRANLSRNAVTIAVAFAVPQRWRFRLRLPARLYVLPCPGNGVLLAGRILELRTLGADWAGVLLVLLLLLPKEAHHLPKRFAHVLALAVFSTDLPLICALVGVGWSQRAYSTTDKCAREETTRSCW